MTLSRSFSLVVLFLFATLGACGSPRAADSDAIADAASIEAGGADTYVPPDAPRADVADAGTPDATFTDATREAATEAGTPDASIVTEAGNPCATVDAGCGPLTVCSPLGDGGRTCIANDPSLAALDPSDGTLAPAFASATTSYDVTVGLSASSLGLRPTATVPAGSTITVDGTTVPSGQSSVARTLALGNTVFTVVVTAAGGATRTYTVTVHRATGVLQEAYLKAGNTAADNLFGLSVAVSGNTIVVGAFHEDGASHGVNGDATNSGAVHSGAAYVFVRNGETWTQQAYLKASNATAMAEFGASVAIDGDTIAVGADTESGGASGVNGDPGAASIARSGAAYVFVRNGTTWTQQAYIKASNTGANDAFGQAVELSGDTLAVGATYESGGSRGINGDQTTRTATNSGAAYVFVRNGTTWTQQAYLKASNADTGDTFGAAMALEGDTLAISAFQESSGAVGIGGDQGDNSATHSGAVYVFTRAGTTWTQQAYVKASNTDAGDGFGTSVALSGETLAVGAFHESSHATGVGGDQGDNSATGSGAAYVFTRAGTTWSQQAYVKASNTDAGDNFGFGLALAGDLLVVGAPSESSNARGIGGDASDNSAAASGAAYAFARTGTTWSQRSYVKSGNSDAGDHFGYHVEVSGDTLVISAYGEASHATGVGGDASDNSATQSGAAYVVTTDN